VLPAIIRVGSARQGPVLRVLTVAQTNSGRMTVQGQPANVWTSTMTSPTRSYVERAHTSVKHVKQVQITV
jgi:hypothetical protein